MSRKQQGPWAPKQITKPARDRRIFIVGDSIIRESSPAIVEKYPLWVRCWPGAALNPETVRDVYRLVQERMDDRAGPVIIVVHFGSNNLINRENKQIGFAGKLVVEFDLAIRRWLTLGDVRIVINGILPRNFRDHSQLLNSTNEELRRFCEGPEWADRVSFNPAHRPFIHVRKTGTTQMSRYFARDMIHLNGEGTLLLDKMILKGIW